MDATFVHVKDIACAKSEIYVCMCVYTECQHMLPAMHPKLWWERGELEEGNLNHQGINIVEYAKK